MSPRCETIAKLGLPLFRSLVAKELVNTYNLTQMEAAEKLGTTQAAISQYLSSKRASACARQLDDVLPEIQAMANETARKLFKNQIGPREVSMNFCNICLNIGKDCSKSSSPVPEYFL
jgi:hypothetical protein